MENETDYDYETLKEVGKVTHEALLYAKGLVKIGATVREVCEKTEKFVESKGMVQAFPVNISINQNAAHYTASINDTLAFTENDLVKVDLGARKGDYLGDHALTVDLSGKHSKLVETADETLQAALSMVKAGRKVNEIGREVEKITKAKGLTPIKNLGGHAIERDELHASIFIPNFDNGDTTELKEGQVIAIETFITDGVGYVVDTNNVQIFQKVGDSIPRTEDARLLIQTVDEKYLTFPFALRWLTSVIDSEFKIRKALNELGSLGMLESFPTLVEKSGGMVSQSEVEMIVEKDSCTIVTK
jgi:methionyl aminopeptidase